MGEKYQGTRHNLGFEVIDRLAADFGATGKFKAHSKIQAQVCELKAEHGCILVKPTTMMNLSGQAVGELMRYYKADPESVWVVYDELDLPFGAMRVKLGGSSAGHNGVQSIIEHISKNFWRIRLGIGNQHTADTASEKFVLDKFNSEEKPHLPSITEHAADHIARHLKTGELTEHSYNLI